METETIELNLISRKMRHFVNYDKP